jgi:hypothetical protein
MEERPMKHNRRRSPGKPRVSPTVLHEQPRPPRSLRPDLPARLEQAILTALKKDRSATGEPAVSAVVAPPPSSSDARLIAGVIGRHRGALGGVAAAAVLLVVGAVWFLTAQTGRRSARETALSIADLEVVQLTTSGTAGWPAISPDGAYVAYLESGGRAASLRVRQVATGSNVEIVPPVPGVVLGGPSFTPDGVFVDYLRSLPPTPPELWRIPTLGGQPRRLTGSIASRVSWSPNGRQMAYVRAPTVDAPSL